LGILKGEQNIIIRVKGRGVPQPLSWPFLTLLGVTLVLIMVISLAAGYRYGVTVCFWDQGIQQISVRR